jgi:DNA gyrase subunit B
MANKNLYNEKSIESLSPLEFTRLRPQVYCGDTTYSTQLLVEILSNSIDEYRLGHGTIINITIDDRNAITVTDEGQGFIPNTFRDDGKTILQAAYEVINTSGKYRDDGTYEGTSLGMYGIGSKITTFLSHWLEVETYRDGQTENILFNEGVFYKRTSGTCDKHKHGTKVSWLPSEEFFTHVEVEDDKIQSLLRTTSCLCPGLLINYTNKGKKIEYFSKNGLSDLADDAIKGKEIIGKRFTSKFENGKNKLDFILTYTSSYSSTITAYVNTGLTERGPHITVIKALITRELNKFFLDKKWFKDKKDSFSGDDIQEGIYIVFNLTAPSVAYNAQVKTDITQIDMTPFTTILAQEFQTWLAANEKEIKKIFDKANKARAAREAAKKARDNARNQGEKKVKALKFDSKLADCHSKDRSKCEIYITEGDSASANLKTARNNEFQAVMPVRGKILNCQKASLSQIQANAEIRTMLDAFGLQVDPIQMKIIYNEDNLRYDKIIIMSDADIDGAHIKNLFYTFIWNFCPELIRDGHIYAGVPPLYKIIIGKEYKYLKNDAALEEFKKHVGSRSFQVQRLKGLGEMSVEETEETLTDPEGRIIKQITVEDVEKTNKLFEDLMGTGVTARKDFIKEHSKEAVYNAE